MTDEIYIDTEKEIYEASYNKGYLDGKQSADNKSYENGFKEGVQVKVK
jgi:hypothetical protein